jgi:hypothetical protein
MLAYTGSDGVLHLALLMAADGRIDRTRWRRAAGTRIVVGGDLVVAGDQEVLIVEGR